MKDAHWRPAEWAMIACPGDCACREAKCFSRETCEALYQQGIRDIIADIQSRDPPELQS